MPNPSSLIHTFTVWGPVVVTLIVATLGFIVMLDQVHVVPKVLIRSADAVSTPSRPTWQESSPPAPLGPIPRTHT